MKKPKRLFRERRQPAAPETDDLSRYCVLVPCQQSILLEVDRQLQALERLGVPVFRMGGCSEISFCRSQMASLAMQEGREAILFIDSDILFRPEDAIAILRRPEPIVAGVYAQKSAAKVNCDFGPGIAEVGFGTQGRDYEVQTIGAGFLRIRWEAIRDIITFHELPACTTTGSTVWPLFLPLVARWEETDEWSYYGEDAAFCWRARQANIPIIGDTRICLQHCGLYPYGWETAAGAKIERTTGLTMPIHRYQKETP